MSGWQWFIHTADKAQKRQSRAFEEVNEIKKKGVIKKVWKQKDGCSET